MYLLTTLFDTMQTCSLMLRRHFFLLLLEILTTPYERSYITIHFLLFTFLVDIIRLKNTFVLSFYSFICTQSNIHLLLCHFYLLFITLTNECPSYLLSYLLTLILSFLFSSYCEKTHVRQNHIKTQNLRTITKCTYFYLLILIDLLPPWFSHYICHCLIRLP